MSEPEIVATIQAVLDEIRPVFQRDRGDIEFVSFSPETGVVTVRLLGMCRDCGMSEFTLRFGVEETLRERLPQVTAVVAAP